MSTPKEKQPLHLLSLDGGGVRGLSSILILKQLMEDISRKRGRTVHPWEEFDMIGGTSTGGLIAIMLGRLRMTLDECETAYLSLSEQIFTPRRSGFNPLRGKDFLLADGKFDHKILEGAIKNIIAEKTGNGTSTLLKDSDTQCRVFVCATRTGNSEVAIFRSYDTKEPKVLFEECKIWEACRATSAATTFFDPIRIGKFNQEFADGGILYNNPIGLVEREALTVWPDLMDRVVIVSVGTGSAPGGEFRGNLKKIVEGMKKIVIETEKTNNDFLRSHRDLHYQNRVCRFNVFHGLAKVGLEEWKERETIANTTQTYLESGDTQRSVSLCVEQLCRLELPKTVSAPAEYVGANPAKLYSDRHLSEEECFMRDLETCIHSLGFPAMESCLNSISFAYGDTCDWLFNTPEFTNWRDQINTQYNHGILWIKGHPGVGKSTLMKHTLSYYQEELKNNNITYYFFSAHGSLLEKSPLGMFRSLAVQLLQQDSFVWELFVERFRKKKIRHGLAGLTWEAAELNEILLQAYKTYENKQPLLLIDALDECNCSEVHRIVNFVEILAERAIRSGSPFRICLSSRHYPNIDVKKKTELAVEKQTEHDRDICKYVQSNLRTADQDIQKAILKGANHIFMWAVLVVQHLNTEFGKGDIKAMWKKLDEIPSDLDNLFSKLLKTEDSEDDKRTTILLFQWVLFSFRPLKSPELYFAVIAGTNPNNLENWKRSQINEEMIRRFITNASKGLVEIGEQSYVRFIHRSVTDYLTRNQKLTKLDPTLAPDAIGRSHDRLASCCMAYIMQKELRRFRKMRSSAIRGLEGLYPTLCYAVEGILPHAEAAQGQKVTQIPLLLLLQKQDNYVTFQIYYDSFQEIEAKKLQGSHLLYALCLNNGYRLILASLLEHGTSLNDKGGYYGTALQAAVARGNKEIVMLLLNYGVDVNVQGGHYDTALQAAAVMGNENFVALLLEHGADTNAQGGFYGTILQATIVARSGEKIISLLLKYGADVNAQGGHYGTALIAAIYQNSQKIVELLLDHEAHIDARNDTYGTATIAAAVKGNVKTFKLLLHSRADINAQGGIYSTALQAAAAYRNIQIIALLLENGAAVDTRGGKFRTALIAATYWDCYDVVKLLLENGADIDARSEEYGTAFEVATTYRYERIAEILRKYGAR